MAGVARVRKTVPDVQVTQGELHNVAELAPKIGIVSKSLDMNTQELCRTPTCTCQCAELVTVVVGGNGE